MKTKACVFGALLVTVVGLAVAQLELKEARTVNTEVPKDGNLSVSKKKREKLFLATFN
jgi:hypothetical protein